MPFDENGFEVVDNAPAVDENGFEFVEPPEPGRSVPTIGQIPIYSGADVQPYGFGTMAEANPATRMAMLPTAEQEALQNQGVVAGTLAATGRAAVTGAGEIGKGAAGLSQSFAVMPSPEEFRYLPQDIKDSYLKAEEERIKQNATALGKLKAIQENPGYQFSAKAEPWAKEVFGVSPENENRVLPKVGEMVGGLIPLVASGPLGPVTIGVQSFGAHLGNDFEQLKSEGMSDEDAAQATLDRALKSGVAAGTIFTLLPKPLRKLGDKYLIERFGETAVKRWVSARAAGITEGAVVMPAAHAAENVISGRPITEGLPESALAGAAMVGIMKRPKTEAEQAFGGPQRDAAAESFFADQAATQASRAVPIDWEGAPQIAGMERPTRLTPIIGVPANAPATAQQYFGSETRNEPAPVNPEVPISPGGLGKIPALQGPVTSGGIQYEKRGQIWYALDREGGRPIFRNTENKKRLISDLESRLQGKETYAGGQYSATEVGVRGEGESVGGAPPHGQPGTPAAPGAAPPVVEGQAPTPPVAEVKPPTPAKLGASGEVTQKSPPSEFANENLTPEQLAKSKANQIDREQFEKDIAALNPEPPPQSGKIAQAVPVSEVESLQATENGGRIAIVLPDGTAVVGGIAHADTWNKAIEKGVATDTQLANGFAGFVKPDGTAWGVNGKPLQKVENVFIVGDAKPRPANQELRPPEPSTETQGAEPPPTISGGGEAGVKLGYSFSEPDIQVGKPSVTRKKRPTGDDIVTRVEVRAPIEITNPENWPYINSDHVTYSVEARGNFDTRKAAKKSEPVWRVWNPKTKEFVATELTFKDAVERAKSEMVRQNFSSKTEREAAPAEKGATPKPAVPPPQKPPVKESPTSAPTEDLWTGERTPEKDKLATKAFAKAQKEIDDAKAEQNKIKPTKTGFSPESKAAYDDQQAKIDAAKALQGRLMDYGNQTAPDLSLEPNPSAPHIEFRDARPNPELDGTVDRLVRRLVAEHLGGGNAGAADFDLRRVEPGGGPLPEPGVGDAARLESDALRAVASAFGQRLIFLDIGRFPIRFSGVVHPEIPNTIFINSRTAKPMLALVGHELAHAIQNESPELYRELLHKLGPLIKDFDQFSINKQMEYLQHGLRTPAESKLREELAADLFSDSFSDPRFWNKLAEKEPSLFLKLSRAALDFLKSLLVKLKGDGAYQHFSDIGKAHDAIAGTLARFAKERGIDLPPEETASAQFSLETKPDEEARSAQVHGMEIGQYRKTEHLNPIVRQIKAEVFDANLPVTPERTEQAWDFANRLTNRAISGEEGRRILDKLSDPVTMKTPDAGLQLVRDEFGMYALKLAVSGDDTMLRYWLDHSADWETLAGGGGSTAAGRAQRATQEMSRKPVMASLERAFTDERIKAAASGAKIGQEKFLELVGQLRDLKLPADELEDFMRKGKTKDGRTLDDILGTLPETPPPSDPLGLLTGELSTYESLIRHLGRITYDRLGELRKQREWNVDFPLVNMREKLAQSGGSRLAHQWWQILSTDTRAPEGHLYTADKVLQGELSGILREALDKAGITTPERPPTLSDFEKLAMTLGKGELRGNKLEVADNLVREEIQRRKERELEGVEDPNRQTAIEEKYEQLMNRWDEASSAMVNLPSSERLFRRMTQGELADQKVDWNDHIRSRQPDDGLRSRIVDSLLRQTQDAATNRLDLTRTRTQFEAAFDKIAATERNRFEMNQIAKRALESFKLTGEPESDAQAIIKKYAEVQSDTPTLREASRKQVKEVFSRYLNGDIPNAEEFRASLETVGVSKHSIDVLLHVANVELAARKMVDHIRRQEAEAKRAEEARRREETRFQREAESIMERLEKDRPAGAEWLKTDPEKKLTVARIIREYLKPPDETQPHPPLVEETFRNGLIERLTAPGIDVTRPVSERIADMVYARERAIMADRAQHKMERAADPKRNLGALIREILNAPYQRQQDPAWRKETATNWFLLAGLRRDQAVAATELFMDRFNEAYATAQENLTRQILDRKAPAATVGELVKLIRAGVFDPKKPWLDELAAKHGWKRPTDAEMTRLGAIDEQLSKTEGDPAQAQEHAEALSSLANLIQRWNLPPPVLRTMAAQLVGNLLTSIRTVAVQLEPNVSSTIQRLLQLSTEPRNLARTARAVIESYRGLLAEYKEALSSEAYTHIQESERLSSDVLRYQWQKGLGEIKSENQATRAKGYVRLFWNVSHYFSRNYNAMDQANAMMVREQQLLLVHAPYVLKALGLSRGRVNDLIKTFYDLKGREYARAIAPESEGGLGMRTGQAVAHVKSAVPALWERFLLDRDETGKTRLESEYGARSVSQPTRRHVQGADVETLVREMRSAADYDATLAIGRLAKGVAEEQEGGLISRAPLGFHFWTRMGRVAGGGSETSPMHDVANLMLLGFFRLGGRTARNELWSTPYGLFRFASEEIRRAGFKATGREQKFESWWKQSLAYDSQERWRLRQAISGTVAMAALGWLGAKTMSQSSDPDDVKEALAGNFKVFINGGGPKNRTLADAFSKLGFRPNSITVWNSGKPTTIPMTRAMEMLGVLMTPLAAYSDYKWSKREAEAAGKPFKDGFSQRAAIAAGTYLSISGQRGMFQNIEHLARTFESGAGVGLAATGAGVAGGLLPAASMQRSIRDMFVGKMDVTSVESAILNQIPVLGAFIGNKALNRFGDQLGDRTWYARALDAGSPIAFRISNDSDANRQFYGALATKGVAPPVLRRSAWEQKYGEQDDATWNTFVQRSGALLKARTQASLGAINAADPKAAGAILANLSHTADAIAATGLGLQPLKPETGGSASVASGDSSGLLGGYRTTSGLLTGGRPSGLIGGASGRTTRASGGRLRRNRGLGGTRRTRTRRLTLGRGGKVRKITLSGNGRRLSLRMRRPGMRMRRLTLA